MDRRRMIISRMSGGYAPPSGLTIAGGCVPTDIYPTDAQDIEFEFALPQGISGADKALVLGAQLGWTVKMTRWTSSSATDIAYWYANSPSPHFHFAPTAGTYYRVKTSLSGANRTYTVTDENNVVIYNVTFTNPSVEQNNAPYCLFGLNDNGVPYPTTDPVTLTNFIVREDGVTTHDIVPRVRLADNVAGMLDIITNTFYAPTGGTITPIP